MFVNGIVFQILNETFPKHTFLMNGLIQGVKVWIDTLQHVADFVFSEKIKTLLFPFLERRTFIQVLQIIDIIIIITNITLISIVFTVFSSGFINRQFSVSDKQKMNLMRKFWKVSATMTDKNQGRGKGINLFIHWARQTVRRSLQHSCHQFATN